MKKIEQSYIITGMVQVGEYMRLVLFPNYPVKPKKSFDFLNIAQTGDVSKMQNDAIVQTIISSQPPTLYVTQEELKEGGFEIGQMINIIVGEF